MDFFAALADRLWVPWTLGLFLVTGGYYTLRSGLLPLRFHRWVPTLWRALTRRTATPNRRFARVQSTLCDGFAPRNAPSDPKFPVKAPSSEGFDPEKTPSNTGLTSIQALSTALASTIGTGSIAGVATAIYFGGPGAVFWMWVSAFFGLMTSAAEKALAIHYQDRSGRVPQGGPMRYMEEGLPKVGRVLSALFSLACFFASLVGGGMVQANSIATTLSSAFGLSRGLLGALTALLVGAVLVGGIKRVGTVSEQVVPVMAAVFLGGGMVVLWARREALSTAFRMIFAGAFRPQSAFGGYSLFAALRYGVARGVFTNEAGLGSSAMAHAAAEGATPKEEGFWGIFEVLVATGVICTVTALVILVSGVYDPAAALAALESGVIPPESLGAPLSTAAFATVLGGFAPAFVAVCLLLFAFTSLLGWGYYGQRATQSLLPRLKSPLPFFLLYLGSILLGAVGNVADVWALSDLANGLMALPNLTALLLLSPKALELLELTKKSTKKD